MGYALYHREYAAGEVGGESGAAYAGRGQEYERVEGEN